MKTLVIVTLSFAGLILLLNTTVKNQEFSNPVDNINFLIKTDNLYKAEAAYRAELQNHTDNIDLHYGYVTNHFNLPEKIKTGKHSYKYRDDETIMNYYNTLANETDSVKKDMGNYLLGLCYSYKNDNDNAIKYFKRVKNRNLKYLNNSTGVIYKDRNLVLTIKFFEREIEIDGNLNGAVFNLSKALIATADAGKFDALIHNPKTNPYVRLSHKREFYYLKHDFVNYFKTVWQKFVSTIDNYGFLGALAIALIWLFYLRHIDIYERERWYNIGVVFVLSLLLTEGCYLMYDFANVSLHFNLNGNILNDLVYCVFGIGLIEEITKLVPLLIFLSFSKAVNEPIDYVIYASVSALGFAFMENIQYFQNDRYYIMHGRALASVVAHMCFSSIVAWGFIVSKYKAHYKAFLPVIVCLLIAAIYHGLYDFWLLNDKVKDFHILTLVILVSSVLVWNSIKNNALNNSTFYNASVKLNRNRIFKYLFIALVGVFALEYTIVVINYGPTPGNRLLLQSLLSGSFLFFFMTGKLAQFEIKPGEWERIKIWERNKESSDD